MSLTKQDLSVIEKVLDKRIDPLYNAQKKLEKWRKEIKDDPNILERGRKKLELLRKEYKNDVELIKRGQKKLEQWKIELENKVEKLNINQKSQRKNQLKVKDDINMVIDHFDRTEINHEKRIVRLETQNKLPPIPKII